MRAQLERMLPLDSESPSLGRPCDTSHALRATDEDSPVRTTARCAAQDRAEVRTSRFEDVAKPNLTRARLIPVTGIGSTSEAEQRATSAFLAVLSMVRELSTDLLAPLGASGALKATVETFTEVRLPDTRIRPDGLIRVEYGAKAWTALVEVKTRANDLTAEQINAYWDLARKHHIDHVLTISNEISPKEGVHPTDGLRVQANSRVQVYHLSWTAIASAALRIKRHRGVSDPEQAYLLEELIRYLEHPGSGALDFSDMGRHWVKVRDGAREGTLSKRTEGVEDVAARWDQLIRFAALKLSAEIGEDVSPVFPRDQREAKQRTSAIIDSLAALGTLSGGLRIPHTAGDLKVDADVRARRLSVSMNVKAPLDKGAVGRVSWLVNQLKDAPRDVVIEAFAKNAQSGTAATLARTRDDRQALLDDARTPVHRFKVVLGSEMGLGRSPRGKGPGFIASVLRLINGFYGNVVQVITPWQQPTPKLEKTEAAQIDASPLASEVHP